MALPNSNLSLKAIRNELGLTGTPISLKAMCTHQNINVWSAHRPTEASTANKVTRMTEADMQAVNFGWNIPKITSLSSWGVTPAWTPILPTTAKRQSDFAGYEKNAIPMLLHGKEYDIKVTNIDAEGYYTFEIGEDFYENFVEGGLCYEIMDNFKNQRFGVMIRNSSDVMVRNETAVGTIISGTTESRQVKVKVNNLPTDDYLIYFYTISGSDIYPLFYTSEYPNPAQAGIEMGYIYPVTIFDIWNDFPPSNVFYLITKFSSIGSASNAYIRLIRQDSDTFLNVSQRWKLTIDFKNYQIFQAIGQRYNIMAHTDVDNMWVTVGLKTVSTGGQTLRLRPYVVFDDDSGYSEQDFPSAEFNLPANTTIQIKYWFDGTAYRLTIDDNEAFYFTSANYYPMKLEDIIFGAESVIGGLSSSAIQGDYENILLEITSEGE